MPWECLSSGTLQPLASRKYRPCFVHSHTHSPRRRSHTTAAAASNDGFAGDDDAGHSTSGPGLVKAEYKALSSLVQRLPMMDDMNALQTALTSALVVEEYEMAAAIRDRLREVRSEGCMHVCVFAYARE